MAQSLYTDMQYFVPEPASPRNLLQSNTAKLVEVGSAYSEPFSQTMAQKALFKSQKKQKSKPTAANRHGKVVKHKGGEAQIRLPRAAPAGPLTLIRDNYLLCYGAAGRAEAVPRAAKEKLAHFEQQVTYAVLSA